MRRAVLILGIVFAAISLFIVLNEGATAEEGVGNHPTGENWVLNENTGMYFSTITEALTHNSTRSTDPIPLTIGPGDYYLSTIINHTTTITGSGTVSYTHLRAHET